MIEITKKVYTINELEENIRKRLIDEAKEELIEYNFRFLQKELEDILLEDYGIEAKVYYSLSYSQGDGLHFNCDNLLETKSFIDMSIKKLNKIDKMLVNKLLKSEYIYKIYSKHKNNFREYASKKDIDYSINDYYITLTIKQQQALDNFIEAIRDNYMMICRKLEKIGYEAYNVNDDEAVELLTGYYYDESGRYEFCEE